MGKEMPVVIDGATVKHFRSLKEAGAEVGDNEISGAAAKMGNLDRGRDVIFPGCGAFEKSIPGFLANGSIMFGHKWGSPPVGYPVECEEKGRDLWSKAKFHSTAAAQEARTIAKERIADGLTVGLSIGFRLPSSGYNYFENGKELLEFASETMKLDAALFDTEAIEACTSWCRGIWKISELYEWSIVTVPMNPDAIADGVKSAGVAEILAALKSAGFADEEARIFLSGGVPGLLAARPELSDTEIMLGLSGVVKSLKIDAKLQDKQPSADDLDLLRKRAEAEALYTASLTAALGDF